MNSKGQKFISLILIILLLILPMTLTANERRGADLVIYKIDGNQVQGELIVVKENSLLLKESASGADVTAAVSDTKTIIIVKKSKALEQGGMGLLIGGAVGVATCSFLLYFMTVMGVYWEEVEGTEIFVKYALPYGLIGGGTIGALIGVATGASAGKDEIIQIEGKPEAEIKKTMEELRKKARVPNFQ